MIGRRYAVATWRCGESFGRAGQGSASVHRSLAFPTTHSRLRDRVHKLRATPGCRAGGAAGGDLGPLALSTSSSLAATGEYCLIESAPAIFWPGDDARPEPRMRRHSSSTRRRRGPRRRTRLSGWRRLDVGMTAHAERSPTGLGLPLYFKPRRSYDAGSLGERGSVMRAGYAESCRGALFRI